MTNTTTNKTSILPAELLAGCHERAPNYDRENRFFHEDLAELRAAGYLKMAVPTELGGLGLSLADVCREQRRLAYHAPATALAINMHVYWVGTAADLWRSGDQSLEWLLRGAVNGEIIAAGHAESGNDLPLVRSTTKAERVDGGYRFTGHKFFGSLSPVWTYLGLHGRVTGDDGDKIVHVFMPRDTPGYTIKESWDTIGMRATSSEETVLDGVFIPDHYVARILPAGFAGADNFVFSVFAWFLPLIGNIYYGIARRALDLTLQGVKKKSVLTMTHTMDHHPNVQSNIAEMIMTLETIEPLLEKIAQDWSNGVAHPDWLIKLLTVKTKAVESAWEVVDTAFELGGGFGIFKKNELERLFRDVRLGRIHPANASLSRELVAKAALGIDLDAIPRWG